jgi:hypothetical protein
MDGDMVARLKGLHAALQEVHDRFAPGLVEQMPQGISADTAFAIGYMAACARTAKALVGRDIDDAKRGGK